MESFKTRDMNGKVWTVNFTTRQTMPKKTYGTCDRVARVIKVRKDLSDITVLDTLLHELLHANNEILFEAEEFVTALATSLAKSLLQSGMVEIKR